MEDAAEKQREFSVSGVLEKLGISKSGYYDWKRRDKSKTAKRKERVIEKIKEVHKKSYENYGAPKITRELRKQGEVISERTVGKYMRENGIKAQYIKHRTKTTRDCDYSTTLANILKRDFQPDEPNAAWCTDITYIWTQEEGFVYLTSIMDLYSRKIISWKLSRTMEVKDVLECLEKAKERRNMEKPVVIHSDRGVQFVSKWYQELTAGMKRSYSAKGNPWDNACIESFHSLIKREWLNRKRSLIIKWHTKWYLNISKHFTIQLGFTVIVTMNLLTITNEVLKIKNVSIKCVRILDIVPRRLWTAT